MTKFNLGKYPITGWCLSKEALRDLFAEIESHEHGCRIIEFGGGVSSGILSDYASQSEKSIHIETFEHQPKYLPDIQHGIPRIRELGTCSDAQFDEIFKSGHIDADSLYPTNPDNQHNAFYRLSNDDIVGFYDICLLDGPNGNGRSLAFPWMKDHLKRGAMILVDDFNHYDFEARCAQVIETSVTKRVELGPSNSYVWLEVV